MIEGLVLPESEAGPAYQKIRFARARAFDLLGDLRDWRERREQNVNVVCHQDIYLHRAQSSCLCPLQRTNHAVGHPGIFQPQRADFGLVQNAVLTDEDLAVRLNLGRWPYMRGE